MRNRADTANIATTPARAQARAEVVLRRSTRSRQGETWVRSLFQELPVGVCLIDRSMRVVLWNPAAAEITGYAASELLGCRCYLTGNRLDLERFCRAECPIMGKDKSPSGCGGCLKWQHPWTIIIPVRHVDIAFLILIFRQVPFSGPFPTSSDVAPPGELGRFAATAAPEVTRRFLALTPREREILGLLAVGKTAKPIAAALGVSIPTVRTHIQSMLKKLEAHGCLEAVACLLRISGVSISQILRPL